MHKRCVSCGLVIIKSALSDPYMCRGCERMMEGTGFTQYSMLHKFERMEEY